MNFDVTVHLRDADRIRCEGPLYGGYFALDVGGRLKVFGSRRTMAALRDAISAVLAMHPDARADPSAFMIGDKVTIKESGRRVVVCEVGPGSCGVRDPGGSYRGYFRPTDLEFDVEPDGPADRVDIVPADAATGGDEPGIVATSVRVSPPYTPLSAALREAAGRRNRPGKGGA